MKKLILHIGIVTVFFVALLFVFFNLYLPWTTNHGQKIKVPNFKNLQLQRVEEIVDENDLRVEISDSVFNPSLPSYTVISQYPKENSFVKENRKIYVTISTNKPPIIKMPKLVDASLLNAQMVLQSYGLILGTVQKVPHFADNVVLKQVFKGKEIKEGSDIGKGSTIDLIVGDGNSNIEVDLPDLYGMSKDEAAQLLQTLNLEIGSLNYDPNSDKEPGTVIRQKPEFKQGEKVKKGKEVDLWVAGEPEKYEVNLDETEK
ncbi:MAG: PASTA domain-containing protein [Cytophagales bacterium]